MQLPDRSNYFKPLSSCYLFFVVWGVLLTTQSVAIGRELPVQNQSLHMVHQAKPVASNADILMVQLGNGADQEKVIDCLQDCNGTVISTLSFGPNIKILIVQADPGKAEKVEKGISKCREIASVRRNGICTIYGALKLGHVGHVAVAHSKVVVSHAHPLPHIHVPIGHHGTPASPPAPANPPPSSNSTLPQSSPSLTAAPDDPLFSSEWDAAAMNFVGARDAGATTNTPVGYYVLDTGLSPPSSEPNEYPPGATQREFTGLSQSKGSIAVGALEPLWDSGSHGTSTSSVCISTDNQVGFAGMANLEGQRCNLLMCRISDDGSSAWTTSIIYALDYIYNTPGLPPGPINLSFNSNPPNTLNTDSTLQSIAQALQQKGFMLVNAAGNSGTMDTSQEKYIRRVAAIQQDGNLASFSTTGPFSACAPGDNVPVYSPSGAAYGSGTSFAAPRWCAAIIDVMGAMPAGVRGAPNADLILRATGTNNPQGYIIPNLQAAVKQAAGL